MTVPVRAMSGRDCCDELAVSWPRARTIAREATSGLPPREIPVGAAGWSRLAEDLIAGTDMPARASSAMDGWAVCGPPPWRETGAALAGDAHSLVVHPGCAVRVATGAVLPDGAEAVVRAEDVCLSVGGAVDVLLPEHVPTVGRHIRAAGEEARRGDLLLAAGTTITPPALALAAAAGRDALTVFRRPAVQCIVMGDELVTSGVALGSGVRDALGPQLPGWIESLGGEHLATTMMSDAPGALAAALNNLLTGSHGTVPDVVITTGGTAHGPADHVRGAVRSVGGRWLVRQVAVRPGHPMCMARLSDQVILVALPGNPLAACAALLTLVAPLMASLQHEPWGPEVARWPVAAKCEPSTGVHRLVPCLIEHGKAVPTAHRGSAMLRGMARADGMLVVPPEGLTAGEHGEVLTLPWMARRGRQGP